MAGKSTISITFKLDGDGKGFKMLAADADGFKRAVTDAVTEAEKLNTNAINFAAISTAVDQAQNALSQLQSTLKDFADAYAVQEAAEAQLATAMRNTMHATDGEIDSIKQLCSAQQKLGVIGDEVQLRGAQELATYLTETETLKRLIPVMNDMVAQQYGLEASGESAAQIATMLGKVMNGQVKALSRYGYTFDDAQEAILKFGDESQRAAVLAEVVGQSVGGMNAALAKTSSGKQKQLANTLGDIKEKIGALTSGAMPFVTMAASATIAISGIIKLTAGIKAAGAAVAAWNIKGIAMSAVCRLVGVSSTKSAAMVRVFSSAMRGGAYSATAMKLALRGLMVSTGVGAAIVALTMIVEHFINASERAKDSTNELIDAQKRAEREAESDRELREEENRTLENTRALLAMNTARLKEFNGSKKEEKKLVAEMNDTYGETMGYFASVSQWYKTLTENSETYCQQMVLEARARMLANKIAQKQQDNWNIKYNDDGTEKEYDQTRKTKKRKVAVGTVGGSNTGYTQTVYRVEYITIPSEQDKADKAYADNEAAIENLEKQLNETAAEAASLKLKVTGASVRPEDGGKPKEVWKEDAATLKEIDDNIKILQEQLQNASVEEAAEINKQIALWEKKAEAIKNAGRNEVNANAVTLEEIGNNIKVLQEKLQTATAEEATEINKQIELWTKKSDAIKNASAPKELNEEASNLKEIGENIQILQERLQTATLADAAAINAEIEKWRELERAIQDAGKAPDKAKATYNAFATTLKGIEENIDSLQERLQTASLTEAAWINKEIELWEKKADAIKNAGKQAQSSFEAYKSGWSTVKGIDNAVSGLTETLRGHNSAWEKMKAVVDAFISVYDGVKAVAGMIETLNEMMKARALAAAAESAAEKRAAVEKASAATMTATALGAETAQSAASAASSGALVTANKAATASLMEKAAAAFFAAYASIPFAGIGIAEGMSASAVATVKAIGAMAFAKGGIAYGPTLGLFGEYAGASHNPEVVAPLDRLRSLLKPETGMGAGEVEFRISGESLVGVLKRRNNRLARTL